MGHPFGDRTIAVAIRGGRYTLARSNLSLGQHHATILANGAQSYFNLAPEKVAMRSRTPLPVNSSIDFSVGARTH